MRTTAIVACLAALLSAAGVQAQYRKTADVDYEDYGGGERQRNLFGPVGFNIGGAVGLPLARSSDRFDVGGGFVAGISYNPLPEIGIQAEYSFTHYSVQSDVLPGTGLDGNQTLQYGDLNLVVRPVTRGRFGFYLVGGPGIYNRDVEVTQFEGVATTPYCDPWLLFCFPAAVPVSTVVGSQNSTDFGLNGGVGVYATLAPPLKLYLEGRYHYIWGPSFTNASGQQRDANGQYIPIVLGLAF